MASILSEMDDEKNSEDNMKKLELLSMEKANSDVNNQQNDNIDHDHVRIFFKKTKNWFT